jgi:Rieske Fe-S protein
VITGAAVVGMGVVGTQALAACGFVQAGDTPASSGPVTVPAANVPVGSATIVGSVIVSQPTSGQFKAFSAVCTHQQCLVSQVRGQTLTCPCHGSTFSTTDGSVLGGPAPRPLAARTVVEQEDGTLTVT